MTEDKEIRRRNSWRALRSEGELTRDVHSYVCGCCNVHGVYCSVVRFSVYWCVVLHVSVYHLFGLVTYLLIDLHDSAVYTHPAKCRSLYLGAQVYL